MDSIWQQVLGSIRGQINVNGYETWIKPIQCHSFAESSLVLEVPNNFFRDWIAEHYLQTIKTALYEITGEDCSVSLQIAKIKPPYLKEAPPGKKRKN